MKRNKSAIAIARGKLIPRVESKTQRRRVRRDEHVGNDRFLDEFRLSADIARIVMLADIRVGPAVESAILDRGQ